MNKSKPLLVLAVVIVIAIALAAVWFTPASPNLEDELLEIARLIDGERAYDHVEVLAADYYEGRLAGTAKCNEAATYIAMKFHEYGLEPFGENGTYFETFPMNYWIALEAALEILSPNELVGFYDCEPIEFCEAGNLTSELVYVGVGGLQDYADRNVTNKIAFILDGIYLTKDKVAWAQQQGALGAIIIDQDYQTESLQEPQEIPAVSVTRDDGETMLEAMGFTLTKDAYLNPEDIAGSQFIFPKAHLYVNVELQTNQPTKNVLGILKGTNSSEYILIGGHYDHLGIRGGKIHNGADDNAAGTAVVLELARVLSGYSTTNRPGQSLIFALWTAEEAGLIGSKYFVDSHPELLPNITAAFNMDMNGAGEWVMDGPRNNMYIGDLYSGKGWVSELVFNTTQLLLQKQRIILGVNYSQPYYQGSHYALYSGVDAIRVIEESGSSDHQSFVYAGIPTTNIASHTGHYLAYHKPEDDIELVDPAKLEISGQLVGCSAWKIAYANGT